METNREGAAPYIIKAMEEVERSKKWTAQKAGIALTTFHRKLNGGADFTVTELIRIAQVLGVHPADLLPGQFRRDTEKAAA